MLQQDEVGEKQGVTICTIHSAKGLEWDAVFVMRANKGFLPTGYWPSIDERRRYGIRAPEGFDSFKVLEGYDALLEANEPIPQVRLFRSKQVSCFVDCGHAPACIKAFMYKAPCN